MTWSLRRSERVAHLASAVAVVLTIMMVSAATAREVNPVSAWLIEQGTVTTWALATPLAVAAIFAGGRVLRRVDGDGSLARVVRAGARVLSVVVPTTLVFDALGNVVGLAVAGLPNVWWAGYGPTVVGVVVLASGLAFRWELREFVDDVATAFSGRVASGKEARIAFGLCVLLVLSVIAPYAAISPVENVSAAEYGDPADSGETIEDFEDGTATDTFEDAVSVTESDAINGQYGMSYSGQVVMDHFTEVESSYSVLWRPADTSDTQPLKVNKGTDTAGANIGTIRVWSGDFGYGTQDGGTTYTNYGPVAGKVYKLTIKPDISGDTTRFIVKNVTDNNVMINTTLTQSLQQMNSTVWMDNTGASGSIDDIQVNGGGTSGYSVSGTVTGPDGSAIEGATVSDGNGNSTTTNATGGYSLTLANGTYDLTASKNGYISSTQSVTVDGGPETQDFTIVEGTAPYVQATEPRSNTYVRDTDRTIQLNTTFDDSEGDDINATLYVNRLDEKGWVKVQSWTNLAPGTEVNPTLNVSGGENRYKYQLSDSVASKNTTSFTFRVGGTITVFNGSDYSLLNDRTVTVDLSSRTSGYTDTRTTSDGTLNLTDVPDEPLRANVTATDFSATSLSIDDVTEPYAPVLYPASGSSIPGASKTYEQCFSLTDYTGDFPSETTTLIVKTRVDGSFQHVASERFGAANKACISLQDGETYQLVVDNNDGNIRDIGSYDADSGDSGTTIELVIRSTEGTATATPVELENKSGAYRWDAVLNDQDEIKFSWTGTNYTADDFRVTIYEYGNESNEIRNTTYGTVDSVRLTQPLVDNQPNMTWVVKWSATGPDGESIGGERVVGSSQKPAGIPLDSDWKHAISLLLLGVIAGAFSKANATAGGVAMAVVAAMLWFIGFLPAAVGGGAIALAFGFVAIMIVVKRKGGDV